MINKIIEHLDSEDFLTLTGFDSCILGINTDELKLIYSVSKMLNELSKEMTQQEALEYFEFNIKSAYFGKNTPIFCFDNF